MPAPPRRKRISYILRRAPLGILLMAAVFAMIGVTSVVGGGYLTFFGQAGSLWAGVLVMIAGPAILYLCYNLVRLSRWAWTTAVVLVALLFLSSLVRLAMAPSVQMAVVTEIVAELGTFVYLTRPRLRREFGWGPPGVL